MDTYLDFLDDVYVFLTLDAKGEYMRIDVRVEVRYKATFISHAGAYSFKRVTFGLLDDPASFHSKQDMVLSKFNWQTSLVCHEDVIIYSTH